MCNKFFFSFSAVDKKKLFRLFFFSYTLEYHFWYLSLSLSLAESRRNSIFCFILSCLYFWNGEKKNRKILVVNCLNSKYHFRSKDIHKHTHTCISMNFVVLFFSGQKFIFMKIMYVTLNWSLSVKTITVFIYLVFFFFRRKCGNEYTLTQKYRKRKKQIHPVLFPLGLSSTMNGWMNEWMKL